jgi:hypothetical protein
MKIFLTIWLVATLPLCAVSAPSRVPQFNDYAVDAIYKGDNHPLVMDQFTRLYRTRLRWAINTQQPTFAGRYIVTGWGCGSIGCNTGAIIDAKTGKAYPLPVAIMSVFPLKRGYENELGQEHLYRLDSRLMIFAGDLDTQQTDGRDIVEFYEFKEGEFKFITARPYGRYDHNKPLLGISLVPESLR